MANIIQFPGIQASTSSNGSNVISVTRIQASAARRQLGAGMVAPAEAPVVQELAGEHTAEPIKSTETIERISRYLISQKRYRDNMLFILGINFGLRISDLLSLRFSMLIDENLNIRDEFPILEKKTRNTRKAKKNRYITINDAVVEAIVLYLESCQNEGRQVTMDEYLFRSESNHGGNQNTPLSRMSVDRILKGIAKDLGLTEKVSSHTLRKTFGYHQMAMSGNDHRKLLLLQKIFGHSSVGQTLDYIGITQEEITDAYLGLNLGSKSCYSRFGVLTETGTY